MLSNASALATSPELRGSRSRLDRRVARGASSAHDGPEHVKHAAANGFDRLPTLLGHGVRLREVTIEDASDVLEVFGDPEVVRYWSSPPLADLAAARARISDAREMFERRQLFEWGIALRESDELVGTCSLSALDALHRRAEIGFALGRPAWGRGLARDAVETLLRFGFEELLLERIEADVDPDNARSLALLERQGFRREGLLRRRWRTFGEPRDAVFLGLLRLEWTPSREETR